jgi:hypothetical protein
LNFLRNNHLGKAISIEIVKRDINYNEKSMQIGIKLNKENIKRSFF